MTIDELADKHSTSIDRDGEGQNGTNGHRVLRDENCKTRKVQQMTSKEMKNAAL